MTIGGISTNVVARKPVPNSTVSSDNPITIIDSSDDTRGVSMSHLPICVSITVSTDSGYSQKNGKESSHLVW